MSTEAQNADHRYVVLRAGAEMTNRMPASLSYEEALRNAAEITRRSEEEVAAELLKQQVNAGTPVMVAAAPAAQGMLGRVPAPAVVWTAEGFAADQL